jgi:hypothetical protein
VHNTKWDETEETLIVILYKIFGTNPDFNATIVKKFIDFTARTKASVTFKLHNCYAYHNQIEEGQFSNYASTLPNIFDENFYEDEDKLMKKFNSILEKRQKEIIFEEDLICKVSITKPDNETLDLFENKSGYDLDESFLMENECESILLDKDGNYSLKGIYKIQADWFDYFGILQCSAYREFTLEYLIDNPTPADLSLYLDINNLSDPTKEKDFAYGDELEISVKARNRTPDSMVVAFNASLEIDLDNDLETKDDIIDIKPSEDGAEFEDTVIFKYKKIISENSPAAKGEVHLPKGRSEFRMDIYDISNLERKSPTPVEKINNFTLKTNQYFVKDNIWIERNRDDVGNDPFVFKINKGDGGGNPSWVFVGDYLNDPIPEIRQFFTHPQALKARKGTKKGKMFTEQDLKDQILAEAVTKLLIEKVIQTNNMSMLEDFQRNSISLNTNDFNALKVWKQNLALLEKTDFHVSQFGEINAISQKLSNALYLMLLNIS